MITKKEIIILKKILIELLIERKIGFLLRAPGLCLRLAFHGTGYAYIPHFSREEAMRFNACINRLFDGYWWNWRGSNYDFNNRIDFLNYVINQNVSKSKIKLNLFDVLKLDWYGLKYWIKVKWAKFRYERK